MTRSVMTGRGLFIHYIYNDVDMSPALNTFLIILIQMPTLRGISHPFSLPMPSTTLSHRFRVYLNNLSKI